MEINRRKHIGLLLILGICIVLSVALSGCSQERTWKTLSTGTYEAYPFTFSEGERLEVILNSASASLNIMILHGGNFSRYQNGEDYVADEYREGVNSTRIDFYAPVDGEYYLVLENRGPGEAKIDLSYTYHTAAKYETIPLKGTISPVQKRQQEVSSSLVQTPATTAIPVQTTQPGAVPAQDKTGVSEAEKLYEEAVVLADQGDLIGALTLMDQAIQIDPNNVTVWLDRGEILYYMDRYPEAITAAEQAITLDPNSEIAWNLKAAVLLELERNEEALAAAERAITLDPNYVNAWVNKAVALVKLGRYAETLTASERATTMDPNDPLAWKIKAFALLNLERYEEALTAAERATTLDPNDVYAWNLKAGALDSLGRYEEALTAAEVATTANPDYMLAWNTKGWIQMNLGRYSDAIASFDRALEIDPEYETAKNNKALALKKLGS